MSKYRHLLRHPYIPMGIVGLLQGGNETDI